MASTVRNVRWLNDVTQLGIRTPFCQFDLTVWLESNGAFCSIEKTGPCPVNSAEGRGSLNRVSFKVLRAAGVQEIDERGGPNLPSVARVSKRWDDQARESG